MGIKRLQSIAVIACASLLISTYQSNPAHAAESLEYTYSIASAQGVAVSPDGTSVWVASFGGTLSKFAVSTHATLQNINLGGTPNYLAINPSGTKIYVIKSSSVVVVDTSNGNVLSTITLSGIGRGLRFSPDGSNLFVTYNPNSLARIQTSNDSIATTTTYTGSTIGDIDISSDGTYGYIVFSTKVMKIQLSDLSEVSSLTGLSSVSAVGFVALSSDGTFGYTFPNTGTSGYKFKTSDMSLLTTFSGLSSPGEAVFSPDGAYLFLANEGGSVIKRIKVSDDSVSNLSVTVNSPRHIAIDPLGKYLLASSNTNGKLYQVSTGSAFITASLSVLNSLIYRTNSTVTLSTNSTTGTVTFYANGKNIPNCRKLPIVSSVATCNFKPTLHGVIVLKGIVSDSGSSASIQKTVSASKRTNIR